MQKYQIIARKFRPRLFRDVVGQSLVVTILQNSLLRHQVGQAYLFCGGQGCGKTTLARLLAKALCCTNRDAKPEPCLTCPECLAIQEGRSLNLLEIDGASNRSIDDIRRLSDTVGYAPSSGLYKIYLIDEVHMLTKEAFNALLKTLEEPPSHVKFFFATTEPHKIPSTIVSRCQRFHLQRIPPNLIQENLQAVAKELHIDITEPALALLAFLAEGSLRDGQSLLDQVSGLSNITEETVRQAFNLLSTSHLELLDQAITSSNRELSLKLAQELFASGRDYSAMLDELMGHFRQHLVKHLHANPKESLTPYYLNYEGYPEVDQLTTLLETVIAWSDKLSRSRCRQIHFELLFVQLATTFKKTLKSLPDLISRLLELEERLQQESSQTPSASQTPPQQSEQTQALSTEKTGVEQRGEIHYQTLVRFAATELEATIRQS